MEKVLTEELLAELIDKPCVDDFIDKNEFANYSFCDYLNQLKDEKGLSRKDIIHKTSINETHAYQIFQGSRGASRDKVLQLAFAMQLNLKQTNRLLYAAGVSTLYCKCRRDAIIIFYLQNNYDLQECDEKLYQFGEDTLTNE